MKGKIVFGTLMLAATILALAVFVVVRADPMSEFYVSTAGDDGNPGTELYPFLTIAHAQTAVRAEIAGGMTSDVTVYLRGGTYRITSSLEFDTSDSGRDGFDVIYRNYASETPIISGGEVIGGPWTDEGGGIYSSADVGSLEFRQLWVNDTRATRAREPDVGYYSLVAWDKTNARVKINAAEISSWDNLTEVELIPQRHWNHDILRVASYSTSGSYAYVTPQEPERSTSFGQANPAMVDGQSYHFENAHEFIDAEGEWYLNTVTNRLYYKLRGGENIGTITVIAPKVERLINIAGNAGNYVENIHFLGLTFQHSTWTYPSGSGFVGVQGGRYSWGYIPGAIQAEFVQDLLFHENAFEHFGGSGVIFYQGTRDNVISCNTFTDISGTGIGLDMMCGLAAPVTSWADEVYDNDIGHIGKDYYGSVGIFGGYPADAAIQYNTLHDLPYSGISVGWGWTLEDNPQHDNDIGYNEIYDIMQMMDDGGGIYTLSKSPGTRIHDNYVYDLVRSPWAGTYPIAGIYLDNGSDYITVDHNTNTNVPTQIHVNPTLAGAHNTFHDNNGGAEAGAGVRSPCESVLGPTATPTPTATTCVVGEETCTPTVTPTVTPVPTTTPTATPIGSCWTTDNEDYVIPGDWAGTSIYTEAGGGYVARSATHAHTGSYSYEHYTDCNDSMCWATTYNWPCWVSMTSGSVEAWILFTEYPGIDVLIYPFITAAEITGPGWGLNPPGHQRVWRVYYDDRAGHTDEAWLACPVCDPQQVWLLGTIVLDVWHKYKVEWDLPFDSTEGTVNAWFDGILQVGVTGLTTTDNPAVFADFDVVFVGPLDWHYLHGDEISVYVDDAIVCGCFGDDPATPTPSPADSCRQYGHTAVLNVDDDCEAILRLGNVASYVPGDAIVTRAKLYIYGMASEVLGETIYVTPLNALWGETTTDWCRRLVGALWGDEGAYNVPVDRSPGSIANFETALGWIEIDLPTALIEDWAHTEGANPGLIFHNADLTGKFGFASREWYDNIEDYAPYINVWYTTAE